MRQQASRIFAGQERSLMRIGYVLKRYPRLSETFILQEILQMERRGADLVLFAIMDPRETIKSPLIDQVTSPVVYLQRSLMRDMPGMLADHHRLLLSAPGPYRTAVHSALEKRGRRRTTLKVFLQAGRLARLARDLDVAHLHAHFAHNPAALARYASLLTGIPFSFTAHAKDLYTTRPESIADKVSRAAFVTTCTAFNARYLCSIIDPGDRRKIHTVYHGVDTERFRPPTSRARRSIPSVISVGRLVPKKGYRHLIAAAELLQQRGARFRLDIFGGGPLEGSLRSQVAASGLGNIIGLHGACPQDELIRAYQQADIFVLAPAVMDNGDRDGIPNVLLEAMACGLPVVSTQISGIPEAVSSGVNGLLCPPSDPGALANALKAVLDSDGMRERLGNVARATVCDRFDATDNAEALAQLLHVGSH